MKTTLVTILLLAAPWLHGQMLRVEATPKEEDAIVFNERFIARNAISAINGERMVKRDNEPMRTRPERYRFRFNDMGQMTYSNTSYGRPGSGKDTSQVFYTLDEAGRVLERMRNDLNGLYSVSYELDSAGRNIRETYTRLENLGTDRYDIVPGERTEIRDEHFRFETLSDSSWRRTTLNDLGLPYREEIHTHDALGYLTTIEDRYLISHRRSRITFRYDDKGRIIERTQQPDLAVPDVQRRTYTYDAVGNLLESDAYHGDRHVHHEEYLYEEHSMLLSARLTKDMDTGVIHVVRYRPEKR